MDNYDGLFADGEPATPVSMQCLGLELDYSTEAFGTPVEVLVVAKVLYNGDFAYRLISTKELNSVEAMGMFRWGQLLLEDGILSHCACSRNSEEEE